MFSLMDGFKSSLTAFISWTLLNMMSYLKCQSAEVEFNQHAKTATS